MPEEEEDLCTRESQGDKCNSRESVGKEKEIIASCSSNRKRKSFVAPQLVDNKLKFPEKNSSAAQRDKLLPEE